MSKQELACLVRLSDQIDSILDQQERQLKLNTRFIVLIEGFLANQKTTNESIGHLTEAVRVLEPRS